MFALWSFNDFAACSIKLFNFIIIDGFTYERSSISSWFDAGNNSSPMTNKPLPNNNLIPNRSLKNAIMRYFGPAPLLLWRGLNAWMKCRWEFFANTRCKVILVLAKQNEFWRVSANAESYYKRKLQLFILFRCTNA